MFKDYRFPDISDAVSYDAFFEREFDPFEGKYGKIVLDLYGLRRKFPQDADIVASVQPLPYKVIRKIGLSYRPIEQNLITPEEGNGIYLYDIHTPASKPRDCRCEVLPEYEFKAARTKMALRYIYNKVKCRLLKLGKCIK